MMDDSRVGALGMALALMLTMVTMPISATASESSSCCPSRDFELFLTGDSDNGKLTPFESDLEEEESAEVTSSIYGEVEVG